MTGTSFPPIQARSNTSPALRFGNQQAAKSKELYLAAPKEIRAYEHKLTPSQFLGVFARLANSQGEVTGGSLMYLGFNMWDVTNVVKAGLLHEHRVNAIEDYERKFSLSPEGRDIAQHPGSWNLVTQLRNEKGQRAAQAQEQLIGELQQVQIGEETLSLPEYLKSIQTLANRRGKVTGASLFGLGISLKIINKTLKAGLLDEHRANATDDDEREFSLSANGRDIAGLDPAPKPSFIRRGLTQLSKTAEWTIKYAFGVGLP